MLQHSYNILMQYTSMAADQKSMVDEKILHSCLQFYEKIIEKSSGRQALETFFTGWYILLKTNYLKLMLNIS